MLFLNLSHPIIYLILSLYHLQALAFLIPFTLIPVQYSLRSFIALSMYILNENGDKLHHCLAPFLIAASLLLSFIFIDVV
jgi:hypothetical protein